MSEPSIPVGLDRSENLVHINDARHWPNYYRCPACHDFLIVRKGTKYIHHYAHKEWDHKQPFCELRTRDGYIKWRLENIKKPLIQKYEEHKKLLLVLLVDPYINQLELNGLLPTLNWDDFWDQKILDNITISGDCIEKSVSAHAFHPSEDEVLIPLKQVKNNYAISINSKSSKVSICGTWTNSIVRENDVFIGNSIRAMRAEKESKISDGDIVYVLLSSNTKINDKRCKVYKLSNFSVISFEINLESKELEEKYLKKIRRDPNSYNIDVILPSDADPYGILPIKGIEGTESLIAITPPKNKNPDFEIVSVPLNEYYDQSISNVNYRNGEPRFRIFKFAQKRLKRISIHTKELDNHKCLNFHTISKEDTSIIKNIKPWINQYYLGINVTYSDNTTELLYPYLDYPPIKLDKHDLAQYVLNFEFKNPEYFKFDLVGYFNQQKSNQGILRGYNKSKDEAKSIISSWINEGIETVVIIYDTLGSITLNFDTNQFQDELTIDNNFTTPGLLLSLNRVNNEQPDTTFPIEKEFFTNVFAYFNRDIFTVNGPSELSDFDIELYIRNSDIDINSKTNDYVIDKISSQIGDIGEPRIRGRIRHILNRMKGVDFVGIKVFDYHSQKRLTPKLGIYSDKVQLKLIKDNNDIGFVFINKDDILIDMEGRFNKETIIEKNKTKTEALSIINKWIKKDLNLIILSYGYLGTITLEFKKVKFDDQFIAHRIRTLGLPIRDMPNKTQIKRILGCDINEPIPSGAKRRIRHVIYKMRSGELEA